MEAPLAWNTKINLIGKKVEDPRIHLCEKCNFPILVYGRMIPCKHVFCFDCAKTTEKVCLRCGENVSRIEQSMQGHIFMCDFGYPKHSHQGCRRTYLSQRDLQAHINHRHVKQASKGQPSKERRLSDPRTEPRGERPERRADPNRPDPRLEARTSTYQQVQNYTVGSSAQASSADYGITQAQPSGVPPPSGMVPTQPGMVPPQPGMVPPQPGMVPPQTQMVPPQAQMVPPQAQMVPPPTGILPPQPRMVAPPGMVPPSSAMVQPPPGMVEPPTSSQEEYHVPVRNTNLITVPLQDSGGDYQAPVQYPSSTAPAQGPYPGPVPAEHQAVRPQMGYPPHAGAIMTPQPGSGAVYTSPGGAIPPPGGPYIGGPQAGPHYDQPPHPPPASYGQPTSTTYSAPVSGAWTAPTQSLPGPAPDGPRPPHPPMPDSTSYTEGSYY